MVRRPLISSTTTTGTKRISTPTRSPKGILYLKNTETDVGGRGVAPADELLHHAYRYGVQQSKVTDVVTYFETFSLRDTSNHYLALTHDNAKVYDNQVDVLSASLRLAAVRARDRLEQEEKKAPKRLENSKIQAAARGD
mmetsp:Transcript_6249/g.26464  ORF Transcript_6249/g.26464 Transcript_6249/m.26464 type:complete len:139 (-) Transcript_6249:2030-2446(-)